MIHRCISAAAIMAWRKCRSAPLVPLLLLSGTLIWMPGLQAQRSSDWLKLGREALAEGDPRGALRYMDEVMLIDSSRAEHNYLYAEALRHNFRYAKAAYYYHKIYRRDRGYFYPDAALHLANMYMQSGNYSDAKQTWRRIRDDNQGDPEGFLFRKALQGMRSCDLAGLWLSEPAAFELEAVAAGTDDAVSQFGGSPTPGGHLVYTALIGKSDERGRLLEDAANYRPRLYLAKGPEWKRSEPLAVLSAERGRAEANFAVNADSSMRALSATDEKGKLAIYISGGSYGQSWEKLLPTEGDTALYTQPAFGYLGDEEVLFFSSTRAGGMGGLDIWYLPLGAPTESMRNPGEPLNTPGNEITPHFRKDKRKLYFASDWHYGLGGYDLFSAEAYEGKFAMPQNLKLPWNSPGNDLYYRFNEEVRAGCITSNRSQGDDPGRETCCNNLWRWDEAPYQYEDTMYISKLEELNDYLPVSLYFHNDEPDPRTWSDTTEVSYLDTYYDYLDLLPQYQARYRRGLGSDAGIEAEEAMDRFFLEKVDQGVVDLASFLPLLLRELEAGQEVQLTIKGFASPLARTDYNVQLTARRIVSLINHLHRYEAGAFQEYLKPGSASGGRLEIIRIPFGEYTAPERVSDNPNEGDAIWGIAAATERKIEISSVQRAATDTAWASLRFASEIVDLGTVKPGSREEFSFLMQVGGETELRIDSLKYDSSAIEIYDMEMWQGIHATGAEHFLEGRILGSTRSGKQKHTIEIYGNLKGGFRELNIVLEVAP